MDNSTNVIELAELPVGKVDKDHVPSPVSETHEAETSVGEGGDPEGEGARGNKDKYEDKDKDKDMDPPGGGEGDCSSIEHDDSNGFEPCTEPTPGQTTTTTTTTTTATTTSVTTPDSENSVGSSANHDTSNANAAGGGAEATAGVQSDDDSLTSQENVLRPDNTAKGGEEQTTHQSNSTQAGSLRQLARTESAVVSVNEEDFPSGGGGGGGGGGDPVESSDTDRRSSSPERLGSATMAALETSRINRCCPRFRASPRRHRKTLPERKHRDSKSTTLKATAKEEPSLIAQAEDFDFGQLAFWNYQVDEEVADAPNLEAKVVKVHEFIDEVTNSPAILYDIEYEPEASTCVRGRKDVARAPPPTSEARGSCRQRGKVVKLVPHTFLSTLTPSLPPHPVGTRVLTRHLECSWVNSKTGAKSAIKPTFFSNGKARHFANRALCCLRGGYEDEPPLGWSADLAADPAKLYYTRPRSRFRKAMVDIVTHHAFEGAVLCLIVLNTILLAAVDPDPQFVDPGTYNPLLSTDQGCCEWSVLFTLVETSTNASAANSTGSSGSGGSSSSIDCIPCPAINLVSGSMELPFVVLYSLEALLKILAMGFFIGRGTYLANPWNVLDFVVVVSGILEVAQLFSTGVNVLRLFRLLRPLRTFSTVPPLRNMVAAILNALKGLIYVAGLLLFVVLLFGTIMKELFADSLHSRCRISNFPLQIPVVDLATAASMGWDSSTAGNCIADNFLLGELQPTNCSSEAGSLYWNEVWDETVGNLTTVFFDSVEAWYYTHVAMVSNASLPLFLEPGTVNPHAVHARNYLETLLDTSGLWGDTFGLPNGGRCSNEFGNVTLPTTFAQCVAICHDIGLSETFTCTRRDGTRCASSSSASGTEKCQGTNCDAFEARTWDTYDPGNPMCSQYCERVQDFGPLSEQFLYNWDNFQDMDRSPWHNPDATGVGPFLNNSQHECFWMTDPADSRYCSPRFGGGHHQCSSSTYCGGSFDNHGRPRFSSTKVNAADNFNADLFWGIPVFDNIGWAMLAVFQSLTLEGWVDILYTIADGFSFVVAGILFSLLILFGGFLLMNLTLAVVWLSYDREKQGSAGRSAEKKRLHHRSALQKLIFDLYRAHRVQDELPPSWPLHIMGRLDNLHGRLQRLYEAMQQATEPKNPVKARVLKRVLDEVLRHEVDRNGEVESTSVKLDTNFPIVRKAILLHDHLVSREMRDSKLQPGDKVQLVAKDPMKRVRSRCGNAWAVGRDIRDKEVGTVLNIFPSDDPEDPEQPDIVAAKFEQGAWRFDAAMLKKQRDYSKTVSLSEEDTPQPFVGTPLLCRWRKLIFEGACGEAQKTFDAVAKVHADEERAARKKKNRHCTARARKWCCRGKAFWCCGPYVTLEVTQSNSKSFVGLHRCVLSAAFERFVVFSIVVNAVVLMMYMNPVTYERTFGTFYETGGGSVVEYDTYIRSLEIINYIFSYFFVVECVLKNAVLGFRDYCHDAYNVFDAIVAVISVVDIVYSTASTTGNAAVLGDSKQASAWMVLRTLRLFRILKLARAWTQLRTLLAVVARTLSEVAWYLVLLTLFMFIFALLGTSLFSNRMRFDRLGYRVELEDATTFFSDAAEASIPRSNFDHLGDSMLTVFQVLTGENWNVVMYDCARAAGLTVSAFYFVVLVVLGAMIVLELFVAILLVGFGDDDDDDEASDAGSELHQMRLLTSSSNSMTEALRFNFCFAKCCTDGAKQAWPKKMVPVTVASTPFNHEWKNKVVVLRGVGTGLTDKELQAMLDANSHDHDGVYDVVAGCRAAWAAIMQFSHRAQSAGAVAVLYLHTDDDPFTIDQLQTMEDVSASEDLFIPILFPLGFTKDVIDNFDDELAFCDVLLHHVRQKDASLLPIENRRPDKVVQASCRGQTEPANKASCCCRKPKKDAADESQSLPMKTAKVEYFSMGQDHGCVPRGTSLWLFKSDCPARVAIFSIIKHDIFDKFILTVILAGAILLAWETPLWDPDSSTFKAVLFTTYAINGIFIVEMVMKIVALGFVLHPGSYLRSPWNCLDFVIVIVSILLMVPSLATASLGGLRALRVLRALRPLRSINRAPRLKLVIAAMSASIWPIFQTLVMLSVFFVIFATLAVTYFYGGTKGCAVDGEFDWPISLEKQALLLCQSNTSSLYEARCTEWRELPFATQQSWAARQDDKDYAAWNSYLEGSNHAGLPDDPNRTYFEALQVSDYVKAVNDADVVNYITSPVTSRMVCEWLGYEWKAEIDQSFDHFFASLGALYELSTTEGWVDVMFQVADSRGVDMQPIRDANSIAKLFFVLFIVVCTFFALNLFVGIICDTFAAKRSEGDGSALFVTTEQKQWQAIQKLVMKLKPMLKKKEPEKTELCRQWAFGVVESTWFDPFIMFLIVLNTILLCMGFFGQVYAYEQTLDAMNYILFGFFVLEALLKLTAYGAQYFSDGIGDDKKKCCGRLCCKYADVWNIFDLCIVIGTAVGILVSALLPVDIHTVAGIIRTFRLLRIFRLLRGVRGVKMLLDTIVTAMPGVANIFVLLSFFVVIFSIVGVQLFATIAFGSALNDYANFRSFFVAMLTLLRGSTGENWNGIMHDMNRQTDGCVPTEDLNFNATMCGFCNFASDDGSDWAAKACEDCVPLNGCGSPYASTAFWYIFTLVVTFTLLNVCIAVVLEAWEEAEFTEDAKLKEDAMLAYCAAWQRYDPQAKQYISLEKLPKLLQDLPSPMGFLQPPATISEVHGEPGDVDEYFILEDDAGNTILAPDARGVLKPRKVRRSEIRSLVPMARKLRSTRSRRSTDSASAHSSFRLNSTDSAAVALKLDAHEVLLTRMRVRYTSSFRQSQQEVQCMDLSAEILPDGKYVVSFLPTAIACAHRSFSDFDVNDRVLAKTSSRFAEAGVHPAKFLAAVHIQQHCRTWLAKKKLRMLQLQWRAAVKIQSIGRTFLARRQASARLGVLFQDSTRAHGDVQN